MKKDQFVYVTYIRTTPEKLWKALTEPDFARKFWCNTAQESEWKPGLSWKMLNRNDEAVEAFSRAASLTDDPALREYLLQRAAENVKSNG